MSNRNFSARESYRATPEIQSNFVHRSAKWNEEEEEKTGAAVVAVVQKQRHIGGIIMLYCSRIPVAVFVCFRVEFSAWQKKKTTHMGTFSVSFVAVQYCVCIFCLLRISRLFCVLL